MEMISDFAFLLRDQINGLKHLSSNIYIFGWASFGNMNNFRSEILNYSKLDDKKYQLIQFWSVILKPITSSYKPKTSLYNQKLLCTTKKFYVQPKTSLYKPQTSCKFLVKPGMKAISSWFCSCFLVRYLVLEFLDFLVPVSVPGSHLLQIPGTWLT